MTGPRSHGQQESNQEPSTGLVWALSELHLTTPRNLFLSNHMTANRKGSYSTLRPFSHSTLGPFSQFQHLCQLPLGCCTPGSWTLDTTFPGYLLESQMSPRTFKLSQPPSLRHDNSPFHFSAEPFTTPICLSQLLVTLWCLALRGLLPGESSTVTRDFPL